MSAFFQTILTKTLPVCLLFSLALLLCLAGQAEAGPSFTATLSFYQSFDVTTGMTEIDQTVLTLLFGDTGAARAAYW